MRNLLLLGFLLVVLFFLNVATMWAYINVNELWGYWWGSGVVVVVQIAIAILRRVLADA